MWFVGEYSDGMQYHMQQEADHVQHGSNHVHASQQPSRWCHGQQCVHAQVSERL